MADGDGRPRRGCLFWAGVIAGAGALLLLVVGEIVRAIGARRLADAVATLGPALDLRTFTPPGCADEENAGPLYQQALGAFVDAPSARNDIAGVCTGYSRPVTHVAELRDWVAKNERCAALAREAARRPRCRFDFPYDQSGEAWARHVTGLGDWLTRVTWADGARAIIDGDADGAYDSAATLIALGATLADEPLLLARMMSVRPLGSAEGLILEALRTAPPSVTRAAEIARMLDRYEAATLARTLGGERALFHRLALRSRQRSYGRGARAVVKGVAWGLYLHYVRDLDHADALARFGDEIDLFDRPIERWRAGARGWMLEPLTRDVAENEASLPDSARGMRAMAALMRAAILRGAGDPGPLPSDPFSGKPMLERVDAAGARKIWCVGSNGQDDGGAGDDMAVKVPR